MKPETNLFLRSLIGVKKSSLRRQIDEALDTPGFSKEDGNQLVAALNEISKCNDALTALRKESREQHPATPPLSPETVRIIRRSLKVHLDAVESSFMAFAPLFRDEEAKARAESDVIAARRALNEFNAAYPEEK